MPLFYTGMSATVKSASSPVLPARLENLRFRVMAGALAVLVGRNIRLAREQADLNQRELAQKIEDPAASNTAVSEWERGVRRPSDRYLPLIADALDKPVEWFMQDHDMPTPDLSLVPSDPRPGTEERISQLEDQIRLLRAEIEANAAEVLRRIDALRQPTAPARPRQQA
jgi:transcriptional regulator with XRE-family HTH domain